MDKVMDTLIPANVVNRISDVTILKSFSAKMNRIKLTMHVKP